MLKHFALSFAALLLLACSADATRHGGSSSTANSSALMGIAVPGLNISYGSGQYIIPCPATTGIDPECQYYHNKNLNTWRIPIGWEYIQPTLGGSLNSTYLGYLQNIIRQAGLVGAKVIVDIHNFGAFNGMQIGAAGGPTYAQFANVWSQIATAVAGTSGFGGYELMNEPAGMPSANTVPQMYQAAVTAIRLIDTAAPIYLDGDAYASAYGWLGNCALCGGAPVGGWNPGGNNDLLTVNDPNNNLVYVAHVYGDYNGSGSYPTYPNSAAVGCTAGQTSYQCAQTMGDQLTSPTSALNTNILTKRLSPYIQWCNGANNNNTKVTCAVTEDGVPYDDANWLTTLNNAIVQMQASNILFTYWGAGPAFGCLAASEPNQTSCGYSLGVYPANLSTTPQDTVQMAVLTQYSHAYPSTNYQTAGPNRGTASVASSNFTAYYNAYITKAFTITPYDGGSGGTFTPSSITCAAGYNCSQNFTYTAPGTDVYDISTLNTGQLTNPTGLGYATVADQFSSAGLTNAQVVNVFSLRKIYAPYIGNAVTLRRASDNTTASFGFNSIHLGAGLNTTAISAWANGSNVYVVNWYDQGPNGNNAVPPTIDTTPSNADQPQLSLSCQNSLPCLIWNSNRMEMNSPVNGNTAQTVLSVFAPTTHMTNAFLNWFFINTQTEIQAWINDVYTSSNISYARGYAQDAIWGAMGATYNDTSTIGLNEYTNGALLGQSVTAGTAINYPYRSNANFGWQLFTSNYYPGDLGELVILNTNLTGAQMQSFQSDEQSAWGISNFPSYTWKAATLNQSTSVANTAPWEGVNQGGIGFGTNFDAIPVAGAQSYYANRGMNITRFPVAWEMLQQNLCTGSTTLNSTELTKLDSTVTNVTSAGMDILIDLHNGGNYNYNYWSQCNTPPDGLTCTVGQACNGRWTATTTGGYFVNIWTQLASRYASNPKVKFDLMNEPAGSTSAASATIQQSAITAIRGQGFNNYIFTEFGSTFATCSDVSANSGPAFITLTDSQSKLVLECHSYTDSNGSGTSDYSAQGHGLANVQTATTYALAHNISLFMGETGVGFTPSNYSEEKVMFDYMAANPQTGSGGWIGWTAWGGGPAWGENYYYLFEPRATQFTPLVTPLVDRPMMRFLNTYATGNTWPAAGGAWPNNVQFP